MNNTGEKYGLDYWSTTSMGPGGMSEPWPGAFNPALLPELGADARDVGPDELLARLPKSLNKVFDACSEFGTYLERLRGPFENSWLRARAYYDMADEMALDENRLKSIHLRTKGKDDAELDPARMAQVLPICFEAVKLMEANIYRAMRGSGAEYCEILGQEKSDVPAARINQAIINAQQHYEIPTPYIISDFINGGLVEGSGVLCQHFDVQTNRRVCTVPARQDIWWDEASSIQNCRIIRLRKQTTVGKLRRQRAMGNILFSDKELEAAVNNRNTGVIGGLMAGDSNTMRNTINELKRQKLSKVSDDHAVVDIDIYMDTEPWRWIYVVNGSLIVAITEPAIPSGEHGEPYHPVSVYTPVRRKGMIDGDSMTVRMLGSQDMANAIISMLTENLKRVLLGVPITSDEEMDGRPIVPGRWHFCADPQGTSLLQFPDMSQQCIGVVDYIRNRSADPIAGATSTLRGQAPYANMTATATRDLMNEAATRISQSIDLGVHAMQEFYTAAILLNQRYLQDHQAVRVVGQGPNLALWRPGASNGDEPRGVNGADLGGVVGKDLVPSGYTGSGSKYALTQEALNEAAVIMQTGGNPVPLVRRFIEIKYGRTIDVDEIYPQNGIGNDPMQENQIIAQGGQIRRDPDDNDAWHMQVHSQALRDPQFVAMAQQMPQIAMGLQMHMQEHMGALQQQAAMLASVPGQGGGLGGGSGVSGMNDEAPRAKPKTDEAREAQMETEAPGE